VNPALGDETRNTLLVDLPKATKGRRMSKKTRKKSSKGSSKNSARKATTAKAPRGGAKTSLKTPAAKPRKAVAKKPDKSDKPAKTAVVQASHKPASKPLKSKPSAVPKPDPKAISKETARQVSRPVPKPAGLVEGAKAPSFRLPRDGGDSVSLADFAGQKLVLFFYPRADTPGCTREAIDFTRLKGAFADSGALVLGVSADTVKAQESFRNKHQLTVPLVSDEKHEMLEAYGAWGEKSMYGRTFLGILRTTVLIGADGKIAKIWRNVRVDGHADEVLAAVRTI
jgi:peroxiredoxin Q/BCP